MAASDPHDGIPVALPLAIPVSNRGRHEYARVPTGEADPPAEASQAHASTSYGGGSARALDSSDPEDAAVVAQPVWPEEGFGPGTRQVRGDDGVFVVRAELVDATHEATPLRATPAAGNEQPARRGHSSRGSCVMRGWRDKAWAVAFLVHVAFVVIVGTTQGVPAVVDYLSAPPPADAPAMPRYASESAWLPTLPTVLVLGVATPAVLLALWVWLLRYHAAKLLKALLIGVAVLQAMAGLTALMFAMDPFTIAILLFGAALTYFFYRWLWRRIPLAAATMACSVAAAGTTPGTVSVYVLYAALALARAVWLVMWGLCAVGTFVAVLSDGTTDDNRTAAEVLRDQTSHGGRASSYHSSTSAATSDLPVEYITYPLLVASLFWGMAVLNGIDTVMVSIVVAKWWGIGANGAWAGGAAPAIITDGVVSRAPRQGQADGANTRHDPAIDALRRACTVSLGSVVFGSTVLAALRTVRCLARAPRYRRRVGRWLGRSGGLGIFAGVRDVVMRGGRGVPGLGAPMGGRGGRGRGRGAPQLAMALPRLACGCLGGVAACLASCLERVAKYLTKYAFVHVGLTGLGFRESARATWNLFAARGWSAYANDRLTDRVLRFGSIVTVLASAVVVYFALSLLGVSDTALVDGMVLAVGVSLLLTTTVSGVLSAAQSSVFVCMAMDPTAPRDTHPREWGAMMAAWRDARPAGVRAAGLWGAVPSRV